MDELESLSHTKWDCKYHVVFIPKCRRRTLMHDERARDDVERFVGKVELLYSALTQIDRKPLLDGLASCQTCVEVDGFCAGSPQRVLHATPRPRRINPVGEGRQPFGDGPRIVVDAASELSTIPFPP
jgi:hypothetical protein